MKVLEFLCFVGLGVFTIVMFWAAICLPILFRYAPPLRWTSIGPHDPPARPRAHGPAVVP